MNYDELKKFTTRRGFEMRELASKLNFSPIGLKKSIINESFPMGKVKEMCEILRITPNDLLLSQSENPHLEANNNFIVGGEIHQICNQSGECVHCRQKDEQIRHLQQELVKTQNKLISILEKMNNNAATQI